MKVFLFSLLTFFIALFAEGPSNTIGVTVVVNDCSDKTAYGCKIRDGEEKEGSVEIVLVVDKNATVTLRNLSASAGVELRRGSHVILDWQNPEDNISIAKFTTAEDCSIEVAEGKSFFVDGTIYGGVLSADQLEQIAGKTLKPIQGISFSAGGPLEVSLEDNDQLVIPEDFEVATVSVDRTFNVDTYATVMYPFEVALNKIRGLTFYRLSTIAQNEGVWTVTAEEMAASEKLMAHVPYLVKATGTTANFDGSVTISANASSANKADIDDGAWSFRGTYVRKDWTADDPELPYAYGFVANTPENIAAGHQAGQFKKLGAGAFTKPMRAYLLFNYPAPLPGPRAAGESWSAPYSATEMPEAIEVVIKQKETVVQSLQRPGRKAALPAVKANRWVDVKGRQKEGVSHKFLYSNKGLLKAK